MDNNNIQPSYKFADDAFAGTLSVQQIQLASKESIVNCERFADSTLLYWAVSKCSAKVVEALLDKGVDIDEKSHYEMSPIHVAASISRWDSLIVLQQHGANMLAVNYRGWTALHFAAWSGAPEYIIELLIKSGINPQDMESTGKTAIDFAIESYHPETATLIEQFCKPTKSANLVV
jgi:ankyrin repeat protein